MRKCKTAFCLLIAIMCFGLVGCHQKKDKSQDVKPTVEPPAFNVDSAYAYVKAQTDFGPRTLGSKAHDDCRDYLVRKLGEFCDTAFVQNFTAKTYDGKSWPACNIIGSYAPEKAERIVLSSHWDARPFADHDPNPANRDKAIDGANDGASGVGCDRHGHQERCQGVGNGRHGRDRRGQAGRSGVHRLQNERLRRLHRLHLPRYGPRRIPLPCGHRGPARPPG